MAEGIKALENLATAITSVDSSLAKFDESRLDRISKSDKWTALSRLVSGILPGFWSFQNKIRGLIDVLVIIDKRAKKQLDLQMEQAKQFNAIQENYKDAQKVAKSLAFDENKILDIRMQALEIRERMERINQSASVKAADEAKLKALEEQLLIYDQINDKAQELGLTTEETFRMERAKAKMLKDTATRDFERTGGETARLLRNQQAANKLSPKRLERMFGTKRSRALQKQLLKEKIGKKISNIAKGIKAVAKAAAAFLLSLTVIGIAAFFIFQFFKKNGPAIMDRFRALGSTLSTMFASLKENFESLVYNGSKLFEYFKEGKLGDFLITFAAVIIDLLKVLWDVVSIGIVAILGSLFAILMGTFDTYMERFNNTGQAILGTIVAIVQVIAAIFLIIGIIASFAWVPMLIAGIVLALTAAIQALVPGFANGGVSSGGLAVVGEKGPELVNLPRGSRVHSNAKSRQMVSGGNTIHVHVQGRIGASDQEIRDIAKKVGEHINREINRHTSSGVRRYG